MEFPVICSLNHSIDFLIGPRARTSLLESRPRHRTGPAQDESPPEQPADVRRLWPNTLAPGPHGSICVPARNSNFYTRCFYLDIYIYDIVLGGVDRYEQG